MTELTPAPEPAAPVLHPLVMVDDQKILPRDYILHKRSQLCLNCHTVHEWTDLYARNEIPSLHNMGKHIQNLVPVGGFRFNLPIHIIAVPRRTVPACHECAAEMSLSHLPDPRQTEEWKRIVRRKAVQAAASADRPRGRPAAKKPAAHAAKPAAPGTLRVPKDGPALDDLMGDLL